MLKVSRRVIANVRAWSAGAEAGQGLAEYGLILALVAVVSIVALGTLGTEISNRLAAVTAAL